MVLHLDRLSHRILDPADHNLGGGIGHGHGALDRVPSGDQIADALIGVGDGLADCLDGDAGNLGVGMLVGEYECVLVDQLADSGIQGFEFTQSLMDCHSFSRHLVVSLSLNFDDY